jgi:7-cyano-7-deazaguanine synthase
MRTTSPLSCGQPFCSLAVLVSGGLDSAILLAEMMESASTVHPLYVRTGLAWETVELRHLRHFLELIQQPVLQGLHVLDLPVADLYDAHWSLTGHGVPDAGSPDDAVYLPGRNVLLLAKSMLWCHIHKVPALALGLLRSNPFPDATLEFFTAYQETVNQAIDGKVQVYRPYAELSKREVLRRGEGLPLEATLSCIQPVDGRHCGKCNKCAERRRAFAAAGMADATVYDAEDSCIA